MQNDCVSFQSLSKIVEAIKCSTDLTFLVNHLHSDNRKVVECAQARITELLKPLYPH